MAGRDVAADEVRAFRACWEAEEVQQILESLARLSKRTSKHVLAQRRHERKPYTGPVIIAQKRKGRLLESGRIMLPVVGRDLSRSGIGLVSPLFFEPENADIHASMLRAVNIFKVGAVLDIGLQKEDGELLWLYGTVVRVCTVQHDFLDVGVQFNGRRELALEFELP